MSARSARSAPPPSDPEMGICRGRPVARRFVSPDGLTVLVGRSAADNDLLTFALGAPRDFWLHVATGSGSHVVVRNPDGLARPPRATLRFAAALAARYSKARAGGATPVHLTTCGEVRKPRGLPPGKVTIGRWETVHGRPAELTDPDGDPVAG